MANYEYPVSMGADSETTASSLLKIDLEGKVVHPGVVGDIFGVNHAGFVIHSALHRGRPDAMAVMHSHFAPAAGISAQRDGLKVGPGPCFCDLKSIVLICCKTSPK
jgi:ribulose-5-phosphate 4-epimerase/fuculose-1-phosphate aldolase